MLKYSQARYGGIGGLLSERLETISENASRYRDLEARYLLEYLPVKDGLKQQQEAQLAKVTSRNKEIEERVARIDAKLAKWRMFQQVKHGGSSVAQQTLLQALMKLTDI